MDDNKDSLMYTLKLLQSGIQWPMRKTFFSELETLLKLTKSAGVYFYWVDLDEQKLYAKENLNDFIICNIPIEQIGHVPGVAAFCKEMYVIDDVQNLPELWNNLIIDYADATSVLCTPIIDSFDDCIGVIEFYKNDDTTYTEEIIDYVKIVSDWAGVILEQSVKGTRFRYINNKCGKVSTLLCEYMQEKLSFKEFISKFSPIITEVVDSETIILYEMDVYVQAYYGTPLKYKRIKEFNTTHTFAKKVISISKSLKVQLKPDDPRVKNNEFLNALPIKITSLLYVPLLVDDTFLGIITFININCDDQHEMEIMHYLLKYLVVALQFKRLYDNYLCHKAKNDILLRRLHHQAHRHRDINEMHSYNIEEEDVGEFYFYPKKLHNIGPMVVHMIKTLCKGLVDDKTLGKYVLAVMRCHRQDLPFHNVFQSCDSTNAMYVVLIRNTEFFKPHELLVLLIAAFLFSIDNYGLSNFVLEYIKHPLSVIYYNFYKEKNRYELGKFLIERTGLLSHLPPEQQEEIMKLYSNVMNLEKKYNIQSYRDKYIAQSLKGKCSEELSKIQRSHVMEFLVWCCYHCRHTNVYKVSKSLTDKIYEEYYRNGDILLRRNLPPKRRQNREHASQILRFEVDYISHVLLPGYKLLKDIFPCTHPIYDSAMELMKNYQDAIELEGRSVWKPGVSIGITRE